MNGDLVDRGEKVENGQVPSKGEVLAQCVQRGRDTRERERKRVRRQKGNTEVNEVA